MDIKLALAEEICRSEGYELFPDRCIECNFPILQKKVGTTWFVGCWFCKDRRERALLARAALHKAMLAAQGIVMEQSIRIVEESAIKDPSLPGRNMGGMPL